MNFFGLDLPLGIIYGIFALFWLVGFSNAVNLTDGIDGLVAGLGSISFAAYGLIAWHQHQYDVLIICLSVLGGLLGFFVYNRKPAKIFMGDVGSLALGGLFSGNFYNAKPRMDIAFDWFDLCYGNSKCDASSYFL